MIAPPVQRIQALDVARGFAVLGILFANIPSFAGPYLSHMVDPAYRIPASDTLPYAILNTFGTGKFRSILAMLFGMGLWLQFSRKSLVEGGWPGGYRRRTLFLMLLGAVHAIFIWFGDILFTYSIVAFVAMFFVKLDDKSLKTYIGVFSGIGILLGLGFAGFAVLANFLPSMGGGNSMNFWPLRPGDEANAYLHGTYLNQLGMRAVIWAVVAPMTLLTVGLFLLSLFLTGMLLQRMDFMRDPFAHPKTMKILGLVGTFGLLFCASSFFFQGQKGQATYTQAIEIAFGPMLAAGYLLLLAVWTAKGWAKPIQKLFANVGRIALTAYISQSIICSVIFYGWGFGKFGSMNLSQQLATAALIDVAIIIAATVYLRYFSIGPVEWLWRSISERRKIPFRDRIVAAPSG